MTQETERVKIYNLRYPIIAPLLVHERLQWDEILQRNVWAHPIAVDYAFPALVRSVEVKEPPQ